MSARSGVARRLSRCLALFRYHRPSQFAWRLISIFRRTLRRRLPHHWVFPTRRRTATWKAGAREAFQSIARQRRSLWPHRAECASQIAEGDFQFLNATRRLARREQPQEIDWNPDAPRLWRFHLQCHEYLPDVAATASAEISYALLRSWLAEPRHQSPCVDPDAWHPFCISRRLPVWLSLLAEHEPPDDLRDRIWSSLAAQVTWLSRNCEWDLGGNHLLENLTALYLAESFLDLEADDCSLGFVAPRLLRELKEQVLPSGEHYERAPTYHALMMVCVAECSVASGFRDAPERKEIESTLQRMTEFARWIELPSGQLPLLGDSARDETPDVIRLSDWAEKIAGEPTVNCAVQSDYWVARTERGDRLLFETGPLACDHLPAHGHADLTQIVASLGGRDAIVDTGNFDYEPGAIRQQCRGTEAHNVLDLGQHCDIWSTFRMGRRGHPVCSHSGSERGWSWQSVCHDAFATLAGRLIVANELSWTIIDWIDQLGDEPVAKSRLHWHPDWRLEIEEQGNRVLAKPPEQHANYSINLVEANVAITPGIYCPNFGERFENQRFEFSLANSIDAVFGYQISLVPGQRLPRPRVRRSGHALTIELTDSDELTCAIK